VNLLGINSLSFFLLIVESTPNMNNNMTDYK
jgi:hypothetical protein